MHTNGVSQTVGKLMEVWDNHAAGGIHSAKIVEFQLGEGQIPEKYFHRVCFVGQFTPKVGCQSVWLSSALEVGSSQNSEIQMHQSRYERSQRRSQDAITSTNTISRILTPDSWHDQGMECQYSSSGYQNNLPYGTVSVASAEDFVFRCPIQSLIRPLFLRKRH